jgi:hypothetical protein
MAGWQDAVGILARERELAETGVGLLKTYGDAAPAMKVRGQQLYGQAKAASDSLIEQLLVAIREGDAPDRSPSLRTAISEAVARRDSFTTHVSEHLPRVDAQGAKAFGWLDALNPVKIGAEVVKLLTDSAVTIWKAWREARDIQRQAIATRIGAQRWRAFTDVPPAA